MKLLFFVFCIGLFQLGFSNVWVAELVLRSNIQGQSFKLPNFSSIKDVTPAFNNEGLIVVKALLAEKGKAYASIWQIDTHNKQAQAQLLFKTKENEYLSNPATNNYGEIVFHHFSEGESFGVKKYDPLNFEIYDIITSKVDKSSEFFSYPQINDKGTILYRGLDSDGKRKLVLFDSEKEYIKESLAEENSLRYIFTPQLNNNDQVAVKFRLGEDLAESNSDQIRLYSGFDSYKVYAEDRDSYPKSELISFHNNLGLSDTAMSYIAMNSKGKRQLILQTEKSAIVIAEEGKSEIALLETFAPDVNNKNTVVFRATSISGKRGVYVFEDQKLTKIVEEGDPIVCDLPGECFVLLKEGFPGISGGVAINDLGDIAIHLVLTDKTMEYPLGGSIYVFKKN